MACSYLFTAYFRLMKFLAAALILTSFTAASQSNSDSFLLVRTCGKLSFLSASLGEDRLGSSKLGYVDTAVLLKVVDSAKDVYRVQLSKDHLAYVSKQDVKLDSTTTSAPFYLTSTFSVKGDAVYDYVSIHVDEKLPYKSWMEVNPSKIILELYGVQSNTNWITQLKSVQEIRDVYVNQQEDDVVRVTIELKHKQHWGYSVYYDGRKLNVRVRRQPRYLKLKNMVVAIDAGHGGSNNGSVGATGKGLEKNYTLRFAKELEKYLSDKGAGVLMTRTSDSDVANTDRVLRLQSAMPHLMISLHFNSSTNASVRGVSTYYKHIGFKPLSAALLNRLLELQLSEFGNVGNFNFTLNAPTDFPNALIEIAFLSNADDEKKITDPLFQKQVAKKIYKGIKDWLRSARE